MSDGPIPPGWYADPSAPGRLRWWDGGDWTEHVSVPPTGPGGSGFPTPIGDWLGETFRVSWSRAGELVAVVLITVVVPSVALTFGLWSALSDVVIDGDEVRGWQASSWIVLVPTVAFFLLGQLLFVAATSHQALAALVDRPRLWTESIARGAAALPRLVGWTMVLAVAFVVTVTAVTLVGVVVPVLLLLLVPALVAGGVWLFVKASFLVPAVVAAHPATNPLVRSFRTSTGAFWAIVGRLLLLTLIGWAVSTGLNLVTVPFTGSVGSDIQVADDGTIERFAFTDLAPNVGVLAVIVVVGGIVQAVAQILGQVGTCAIYRDRWGDDELHGAPGLGLG